MSTKKKPQPQKPKEESHEMLFFFYMVREKEEVLVQSFGELLRTEKKPGLHMKKPWHYTRRVPLSQLELTEPLGTKTADDVFVTVPIKAHMEICDTKKYAFDTQDPEKQVMSKVAASVKQLVSQMDFKELYSARESISDKVRENVGGEIESKFGIRLLDIIVDEPHVDAEIQRRYSNVKASEMDLLAANNEATANKRRIVAEAEARKEALKLDGEGIAAQRQAIFENYAEQFNKLAKQGLTQEQAHQVITLAMANDTVRDAAKNGNVILTTTNSSDILSQMAALGQHLSAPTNRKPPANDEMPTPGIKSRRPGE